MILESNQTQKGDKSQSFHIIIINSQLFKMSFDQNSQTKRKYSRISIKKRQSLVTMVIDNDQTIAFAARRLNLKASTARMILNKYKQTGTYPMKKFKKPLKESTLKTPFVKEEAIEESYRIQDGDNHFGKESLRQQVYQPGVGSQPINLWPQFLMMATPYQSLYFVTGLSYP